MSDWTNYFAEIARRPRVEIPITFSLSTPKPIASTPPKNRDRPAYLDEIWKERIAQYEFEENFVGPPTFEEWQRKTPPTDTVNRVMLPSCRGKNRKKNPYNTIHECRSTSFERFSCKYFGGSIHPQIDERHVGGVAYCCNYKP